MSEPEVLTEVPGSLKRLVHMIMRSFYGDEYAVVMDKLIHHPCIKEDDLLELLRFERKQLRAIITTLRNEKFVRARMRVETDADSARTTRHNYYFISYSVFINVVRYKLHHMQRKIQTSERDATSRSSYSCPACMKKFTDLEVDRLVIDKEAGILQCSYCETELVPEQPFNASASGTSDTRSLLAKFNEQLKPVYDLLATVEDIRFSQELLEPEPTDYKRTRASGGQAVDSGGIQGANWSGELHSIGFGCQESKTTISFESDSNRSAAAAKPHKEVPLWISQSTVDHYTAEQSDKPLKPVEMSHDNSASSLTADKDDIMRALLSHEKSSTTVHSLSATQAASTQSSSSDSDDDEQINDHTGDVEAMESDEYEDMDSDSLAVPVGNELVPYNDVTQEMVARMSAAEKAEYIRIGQQLYDQFIH